LQVITTIRGAASASTPARALSHLHILLLLLLLKQQLLLLLQDLLLLELEGPLLGLNIVWVQES
jgi:hypothetical protein